MPKGVYPRSREHGEKIGKSLVKAYASGRRPRERSEADKQKIRDGVLRTRAMSRKNQV